jgi:hypothetical protein
MTQADSVHSTPPTNTPADPLYLPTDISPEQLFRAIGKLRKDARDEIDRLIRFLDETENHMAIDCEPDDEDDDAEFEEDDPAEHDGTLEPSLGSIGEQHIDQTRWAVGSRSDLELDPAESGIGDAEGMHEQVGTQDWQQGAMA